MAAGQGPGRAGNIAHWASSPLSLQTYREPVSDYQVLREKAASQRRDVERALTRFMAKTGETQSLFKDDVSTFPCERHPLKPQIVIGDHHPASAALSSGKRIRFRPCCSIFFWF